MKQLCRCFLFFAVLPIASPHVFAVVSSGTENELETGGTNAGGGSSSSSGGIRNDGVLGEAVSGSQMSSSRFRFFAGSIGSSASTRTTAPVNDLTLAALYAKTSPSGAQIAASAWQKDRDPVFVWEPPAAAADVLGYSYAIDAVADNTLDTAARSFDVATSTLKQLADGRHTFSVKAINTAGNGGPPSTFEIWVDTTPPSITSTAPPSAAMLKTLTSAVSAALSDANSGVDASTIELRVNEVLAVTSFNEATGILSANPASWAQGSNRIELRVGDKLGNSQTPLVWSVIMDTIAPTGSVSINAGAAMTSSVYVTLGITASDLTSGVVKLLISNDPTINFVEEAYVPMRALWRLNAVRGAQSVYVRFVDGAGNVSEPVSDAIDLALTAPETLITGGPSGFSASVRSTFSFMCPEGNCVFSYAIDHGSWSEWSDAGKITTDALASGNHYFRVKAAKETNGVSGIQPDEEDPSPAERTWIIGLEPSVMAMPKGPAVKVWRIE